jgi:hypothetical protein
VSEIRETELRRHVHETVGSVQPSPAPVESIIRRGRGIRLRRAGAAAGALGLAGIIAVTSLALYAGHRPAVPAAGRQGVGGPGGVFASGTISGHRWRLAVQDIADPGYPCRPAIVLDGTDADPVYPDPGNRASVALGSALPGTGFGFIQVPAAVGGITVNGQADVRAVAVTACGSTYHVAGFAYSLAEAVRVTVANPPPGWPADYSLPPVSALPPSKHTTPETPGLWINAFPAGDTTMTGILDTGSAAGSDWFIEIEFTTGGDCYAFSAQSSLGRTQMGACGPVSTPGGPETITALPLGLASGAALTGYAVQVSPATAVLNAILSNGSSERAEFCVVDGRKYAAFVVRDPLRLSRLTWLDAAGRVIGSTTVLPRYGYLQFQP